MKNIKDSLLLGGVAYMLYPELKKQLYDFLGSNPKSGKIERVSFNLPEKKEIQIESELNQYGFDYFNETGFDWCDFHIWSPQYYWDHGSAIRISPEVADELVEATFEVTNMCYEAVDFVIRNPELLETVFQIPKELHPLVIQSWKNNETDLINRLDFLYDEDKGFKFIEANSDTPTVLIEAGLAQEVWAEHLNKKQFNIISHTLSTAWEEIIEKYDIKKLIGFSYGVTKDSTFTETEDRCNVSYLVNTAEEALELENIKVKDIRFIDEYLGENYIEDKTCLWKLYPYEWLIYEEAGKYIENKSELKENIKLMEPAWKIIMANKSILPVLWAMFPQNKYLLPCHFSVKDNSFDNYMDYDKTVSKRIMGREGKNIEFGEEYTSKKEFIDNAIKSGDPLFSESEYILGPPVFQQKYTPTQVKSRNLTIGSWSIFGLPSGIGIREDKSSVTTNDSSFINHFIEEKGQQNNQIPENLINSTETQYQPGITTLFASPQSMKIRERLYGKNNLVNQIYQDNLVKFDVKETPYNTQQQYNPKDDGLVIYKLNKQIQVFDEMMEKLGHSRRRRSYMGWGGSNDNRQQNRQSSASVNNTSQSTRRPTGSHGRNFSRSS